ncbi:molybdenum cofactor guanylyltransferase [Frondihabitans sp. VKM Ac-2883]|uniref:molybdenum cofactor guanylyltransferase n=1 Tax=Frondihabitans sp. VKM Ac-2883 TaxID=2783823 RepID=UPI00188AF496|nr:NTP transferase domain-containing protein [Frondihabitans sp. VKM Ac-2883]MBF4576173.1 NTP transferase domain-containing protein [Frondihabitans sp. VKM Ac-2883]
MEFTFDAVILAGGRASRLGGIDKTALVVDGSTLLERAVQAAAGAEQIVVVSARPGQVAQSGVLSVREEPPFSGPAAGLAAGLAALSLDPHGSSLRSSTWVLVLAADVPRAVEAVVTLREGVVERSGQDDPDGYAAVDDSGHRQPLLALYRTGSLRAVVREHEAAGDLDGLSLRRLLGPLRVVDVPVATALSADVDSPDDARRLGVNPVENADGDLGWAD